MNGEHGVAHLVDQTLKEEKAAASPHHLKVLRSRARAYLDRLLPQISLPVLTVLLLPGTIERLDLDSTITTRSFSMVPSSRFQSPVTGLRGYGQTAEQFHQFAANRRRVIGIHRMPVVVVHRQQQLNKKHRG